MSKSGTKNYRAIKVDGAYIKAHRYIWEQANGPIPEGYLVDHIDGDIHNNALSNLRLATLTENNRNARLSSRNTTGVKGLSWDSKRSRYQACIWHEGRNLRKVTTDREEAIQWLTDTRNKLHGEFACHG